MRSSQVCQHWPCWEGREERKEGADLLGAAKPIDNVCAAM